MKVVFAADHGGFSLKEKLKPFVASLGHEVIDVGADTLDMADNYPPIIQAGVRRVAEDPKNTRGIIIGGSGQGEAIVANRIKGIRAVVYYGEPANTQVDADGKTIDMITSTREHNDSNILSLAGRFITEDDAKDAVQRWLSISFDKNSRHEVRHTMIDEA